MDLTNPTIFPNSKTIKRTRLARNPRFRQRKATTTSTTEHYAKPKPDIRTSKHTEDTDINPIPHYPRTLTSEPCPTRQTALGSLQIPTNIATAGRKRGRGEARRTQTGTQDQEGLRWVAELQRGTTEERRLYRRRKLARVSWRGGSTRRRKC
ncbi:hypothetical protein NL676_019470 [Syzygium grande]|nr:hypothetical protein NL676_019470 [Syzygium grande]